MRTARVRLPLIHVPAPSLQFDSEVWALAHKEIARAYFNTFKPFLNTAAWPLMWCSSSFRRVRNIIKSLSLRISDFEIAKCRRIVNTRQSTVEIAKCRAFLLQPPE